MAGEQDWLFALVVAAMPQADADMWQYSIRLKPRLDYCNSKISIEDTNQSKAPLAYHMIKRYVPVIGLQLYLGG